MNKFASLLVAAATSTLLIGATSTAAFAAPGAAYRLTPVAAVAAAETVVANDTLWKKIGTTYVAKPSGSRPAIVCAQAAKKIGKIEAFEANGQAFDAEQLAKCNEKAR